MSTLVLLCTSRCLQFSWPFERANEREKIRSSTVVSIEIRTVGFFYSKMVETWGIFRYLGATSKQKHYAQSKVFFLDSFSLKSILIWFKTDKWWDGKENVGEERHFYLLHFWRFLFIRFLSKSWELFSKLRTLDVKSTKYPFDRSYSICQNLAACYQKRLLNSTILLHKKPTVRSQLAVTVPKDFSSKYTNVIMTETYFNGFCFIKTQLYENNWSPLYFKMYLGDLDF